MRDSTRLRDRSVLQLDRPQMVWLTLGVVVFLGVAFALGFITGRRAERIGPAAPPADPIAQIESDQAIHDELTFYSKLTEKDQQRRAEAPAATPPSRTEAQAVDQGQPVLPPDAKLATGVKPPPIGSTATATVAGAAQQAAGTGSLAQAVARARKNAKPRKPRATKKPAKKRMTENQIRAALDGGPARRGEYTVQVSAFQSMGEANAFAAGLERKGYKPFVVTSNIADRGTWYRVRMGRFVDQDAAETAKGMLAQAAIPSWVLKTE